MSSNDEAKYLFRVFDVNMVFFDTFAAEVMQSVGLTTAIDNDWVKKVDELGFESPKKIQGICLNQTTNN